MLNLVGKPLKNPLPGAIISKSNFDCSEVFLGILKSEKMAIFSTQFF